MILIVSGLPRSGTSMMMRMLEAGGMPCLWDNNIPADQDNPNGYYEYTPVHAGDYAFLLDPTNAGKAVKLNDRIIHLDVQPELAVIVMQRPIDQVVASFNVLRTNRGMEPVDVAGYSSFLGQEMTNILDWCSVVPHLVVQYPDLVTDPPTQSQAVADFVVGAGLPMPNVGAMAMIPSLDLWRQRSAG